MIEAEQGVIASILIDKSSLDSIYSILKPEMFAEEFAKDCYNEMLVLYDIGEDINVVNLAQRLENQKWDTNTIMQELKESLVVCPTSTMIKSYAKTIINDYKAREVKRLISQANLLPGNIENTISELLINLESLKDNQTVKTKHIKQIVLENKPKYFVEKIDKGIKTGFFKLDDCLGILEKGDVTVIGARPATGKSAIVTQMIGNIASKGYKVGYYNLEMNENQVYERFIARLSRIELTRIRRATTFLGNEKEMFDFANDKLEQYDIIVSTGSKSVGEIKAESRHQNFDIIVIDYLQLIKADKHYANRANEVGDISKAIKGLAAELQIPIILLSQLNRSVDHRDSKEPEMSDLRESGDVEQDASNILLMWNMAEEKREYKGLKVAKQRQGDLAKIGLEFHGSEMYFDERMEKWEQFIAMVKRSGKGIPNFDEEENPFE